MLEIWLYLNPILRKLGNYVDNHSSNIFRPKEALATAPRDLNTENSIEKLGINIVRASARIFGSIKAIYDMWFTI
jgi:hypothetical protein